MSTAERPEVSSRTRSQESESKTWNLRRLELMVEVEIALRNQGTTASGPKRHVSGSETVQVRVKV
jgi:hypothetical protein